MSEGDCRNCEALEAKIAELEEEAAVDKGKLLNHINWLNEANIKIAEQQALVDLVLEHEKDLEPLAYVTTPIVNMAKRLKGEE